jgi:hypothetical protein
MKVADSEPATTEQQEKIIRLLNSPRATYSEKQAVLATLPGLSAAQADATYTHWFEVLSQRPQQRLPRYRRAA